MNLLSISFHVEVQVIDHWEILSRDHLSELLKKMKIFTNFIFSTVESAVTGEGRNYNLLLFFDDQKTRNEFHHQGFIELIQLIENDFKKEEVMVFETLIDPVYSSFEK